MQTTDAELSVIKPVVIPSWIPKVCQPFWEEVTKYDWNATTSIKIMYAESRCNPLAKNMNDHHKTCTGSFGLMQNSCGYDNLLDPATNIRVAYEEKYKKGGFKHWSVCLSIKGEPPKVDCGKL